MLSPQLVEKIKQEGVVLAYLFGSQVSGFTHRESDVDIAVLLSSKINPDKYFEKSLELARLFKEVYPGRERQATILNQAPSLLKAQVLKNGQLLFCADESTRINFQLDTLHGYEDTKPLRAIQYFYLKDRILQGDFGLRTQQL